MKLTIWTFLSTPLHLVLAHSSALPVVALPPFMAAFPLIPVLAYTLIVSAFSYISVRVFKHFKFNSNLFAFIRRKGRFSLFGIAHHEHELLPTTTPPRVPNAAIGVYASSSNVPIPCSSSVDALPGSPNRLISPLSSPPKAPFRRAVNRSLASFPLLEPTCCNLRRSRSLGVLISRPHDWPSRFPPSPPSQQTNLDDSAISGDNIPLVPLGIASARGIWSSRHTVVRAPTSNVSSVSAPMTPLPNPDLVGPLIDISPISTSSSDLHDAPLALSTSSSELAPPSYSSPSEPDSDNSPRLSLSLSQSSDIAGQRIGGASGFAYDWGFEATCGPPPHSSERRVDNGSFSTSGDAAKTEGQMLCHKVRHPKSQEIDGMKQERYQQVDMLFLGKLHEDRVAEPVPTYDSSPLESSEMVLSLDVQTATEGITGIATFEGDCVAEAVVCNSSTESALAQACQDVWISSRDPVLLPSPLVDKIGERLSVSIDTTQPPKIAQDGILMSAKTSLCSSPLQTPTPPASPPLMLITIARSAVDLGLPKPVVPANSALAPPVEREVDNEGMTTGGSGTLSPLDAQEVGLNLTKAHAKQELDVGPAEDAPMISIRSSPSSVRPTWSVRAIDAPPLGLSVSRAAAVEEEVTWPRTPKKDDAVRKIAFEESIWENVPEVPAAQQAVAPVDDLCVEPAQGTDGIVQAPAFESTPSLPGSFPEEPEFAQKDLKVVSAAFTAVAPMIVSNDTSRRRNVTRGLPIDVALAMQLRPGFGVGADPAWMVRFLMAVFGWFAIMIAGRGGDVDVYAL